MEKSTSLVLVLTTVGADFDAAALAHILVTERMAACVNVLPPMTSVYRWKGAVEHDREQQLLIKTAPDRLSALGQRLRELHPYEVPELMAFEVADGHVPYLEWIAAETAP